MFENLQPKLQNRNKSWDTITYMTVVLQDGNENAMVVFFLSFFFFFFAATMSTAQFTPGGPKVT